MSARPEHRGLPARRGVAHLRTNRASRILAADAATSALFRREAAELVGKPLAVLVPVPERAQFRSRLALLSPDAPLDGWRITIDGPSGCPVRAIAHVRAAGAGTADELIWELTGEGEAEEASPADAIAVATADIAGQLGHELNQPLAAIVSYARGAILRSRAGTLSTEDLEQVLSIIVTEAMRVADRIREFGARDERST